MVVSVVKEFTAPPWGRVGIGIGVDFPVKQQAVLHLLWIIQIIPAPNPVGYKISHSDFRIPKRKVNVCQVVHERKNTQIKVRISEVRNREAIFVCF